MIGPSGAGKTRKRPQAQPAANERKATSCSTPKARSVAKWDPCWQPTVTACNVSTSPTSTPSRPLRPASSAAATTPLRHIRRKADGRPNQQDILRWQSAICPIEDNNQPFWDHAAANLLSCLIAYVTEQLPADEQTISSVIKLIEHLQDGATARLFDDLITTDPQSYAPLAMAALRHYAKCRAHAREHRRHPCRKGHVSGIRRCGTALS